LFGDRRRHPARVTRSLFPHLLAAIFRCIALPPRGDTEANRKQTPILRKRPSTNVWNVEEVEETPEKLFDDALKNIGYSRITNDGRTTMIEEMVPKKKKKNGSRRSRKRDQQAHRNCRKLWLSRSFAGPRSASEKSRRLDAMRGSSGERPCHLSVFMVQDSISITRDLLR
jgi:hypothetical protein